MRLKMRHTGWAGILGVAVLAGCGSGLSEEQEEAHKNYNAEAVMKQLDGDQDGPRLFAINSLAQMGPEAEVALPKLKEMTADSNPKIAEAAQKAVDRIEGGAD